jgi:hypothetical protein
MALGSTRIEQPKPQPPRDTVTNTSERVDHEQQLTTRDENFRKVIISLLLAEGCKLLLGEIVDGFSCGKVCTLSSPKINPNRYTT